VINIAYQGKMFPKAVLFDGRRKVVFHPDRKIVALEIDDALYLLAQNKQISRGVYEFAIIETDIPETRAPIVEKEEAPKKKTRKSKKEE